MCARAVDHVRSCGFRAATTISVHRRLSWPTGGQELPSTVVVVVGQNLCSVVVRYAAAGGERAEKGMRVARRSAASLAGPPQPLDKKYFLHDYKTTTGIRYCINIM